MIIEQHTKPTIGILMKIYLLKQPWYYNTNDMYNYANQNNTRHSYSNMASIDIYSNYGNTKDVPHLT